MYLYGYGIKADSQKALKFFAAAAEQGFLVKLKLCIFKIILKGLRMHNSILAKCITKDWVLKGLKKFF